MMTSLTKLERYLRAEMEKLRTPTQSVEASQPWPFVTISRQAGAGGHALASALLDAFSHEEDIQLFGGWQIFDQKLCEIVAADPLYSKSLDSLLAEEYRSPTGDFFHQVVQSTVDQDMVMARVYQVIRSLATIGKAIVVGRAGSHVTQGMEFGVRLRIIAPTDTRIKRLMELHDLNERQARSESRKVDGHRARLLKSYFGADIDDPLNYDAVWNTGDTSVFEVADAVTAVLRHRLTEAETI